MGWNGVELSGTYYKRLFLFNRDKVNRQTQICYINSRECFNQSPGSLWCYVSVCGWVGGTLGGEVRGGFTSRHDPRNTKPVSPGIMLLAFHGSSWWSYSTYSARSPLNASVGLLAQLEWEMLTWCSLRVQIEMYKMSFWSTGLLAFAAVPT